MLGSQQPRIRWEAPFVSSLGERAAEIMASCKKPLDEWQQVALEGILGLDEEGRWQHFEAGVCVPRQNGKGAIIEARELVGILEAGDELIIHSAHLFDTSLEAFMRMEQLLEDGDLIRELKPKGGVSRTHGAEGFRFKNGGRIRYKARTRAGGRGFSADCLIMDEAMDISELAHGSLLPTLRARPRRQILYMGSAVDQTKMPDGLVFARIRERGLAGGSPSLAYYEWSADWDGDPAHVPYEVCADREQWALSTPALGTRITEEGMEQELEAFRLDLRSFAVELEGIGDWPDTAKGERAVIDLEKWDSLAVDPDESPMRPQSFSFDVSPSRTAAAVAMAGRRKDGRPQVALVDWKAGAGWVVKELVEQCREHGIREVVCDGASPASALATKLEEHGLDVRQLTAREYGNACGGFFDRVNEEELVHLGDEDLRTAIRGARQVPLGEAFKWARRKSTADITPLVASTVALWAAENQQTTVYSKSRGLAVV